MVKKTRKQTLKDRAKKRVGKLKAKHVAAIAAAGVGVLGIGMYARSRNISVKTAWQRVMSKYKPKIPKNEQPIEKPKVQDSTRNRVRASIDILRQWVSENEPDPEVCMSIQGNIMLWIQYLITNGHVSDKQVCLNRAIHVNTTTGLTTMITFDETDPRDFFKVKETVGFELDQCSKRFQIMNLILNTSFVGLHSNVLIVDKERKTIERFDPVGLRSETDNVKIMAEDLMKKSGYAKDWAYEFATKELKFFDKDIDEKVEAAVKPLGYKYIGPFQMCPNISPQMLVEMGDWCFKNDKNTRRGFCVTFSLIYTHIRMLVPEATTADIAGELVNLQQPELIDFVRRYNQRIIKTFPNLISVNDR